MSLRPQVEWTLAAGAICLLSLVGCGHSEGRASNSSSVPSVTLGSSSTDLPADGETKNVAAVSDSGPSTPDAVPTNDSAPETQSATPASTAGTLPPEASTAAEETRTFKVEGPENSLRVSFDDVDLLKVLNLDPVPVDAPERLPQWLKSLDGKRIRIRGFMFPPFQDTDIRGFVLARDNQICCFGRTPKEYDLIDIFMRKGVTTHYIQNRPFDVVGTFRIKSEIEKYTAMYELEDAIVIEK